MSNLNQAAKLAATEALAFATRLSDLSDIANRTTDALERFDKLTTELQRRNDELTAEVETLRKQLRDQAARNKWLSEALKAATGMQPDNNDTQTL